MQACTLCSKFRTRQQPSVEGTRLSGHHLNLWQPTKGRPLCNLLYLFNEERRPPQILHLSSCRKRLGSRGASSIPKGLSSEVCHDTQPLCMVLKVGRADLSSHNRLMFQISKWLQMVHIGQRAIFFFPRQSRTDQLPVGMIPKVKVTHNTMPTAY